MRRIDAAIAGEVRRPASLGPVRQLQWLDIAELTIDPRYQREISGKGRRNVRAIAEGFSWARFAPVIVAPVEGGAYAIVDGQHRTTAASAIGVERVPCLIIQADPGEQAEAFRAINGQVTKVSRIQLFKAALAAGDAEAARVAAICREAGVTILGYAKGPRLIKAGETLSIEALCRLCREEKPLALAVLCGIRSQAIDGSNVLRSIIIDALRLVCLDHRDWWRDRERFVAALDGVDLDDELRYASARKARERGLSLLDALYARLVERIQAEMRSAA